MQLQSLMLMLLLMVFFPMMILTSNSGVFFIVISLILLFSSFRNLFDMAAFRSSSVDDLEEDDDSEDLEEFLGLDLKKLESGLHVVRNLIILLYFTYCSFYMFNVWFKLFILTIALYWIYDIILFVQSKGTIAESSLAKNVWLSFINISTISIIVLTAFNKYSSFNF